ncbi:MAG: DUF1837 domain-containing protein [Candidatus Woesearchaeota archaeon]
MATENKLEELGKLIGNELCVTEIEADQLLNDMDTHSPTSKINCNFYLIKCTAVKIREEDFLQFIRRKVIQYTLKKSDYDDLKTEDYIDVSFKAIDKFTSNENSGEVGELILYFLLEGHEKAIQILNKMDLKTSKEMHYHGLDGIHMAVNNDEVILYYGESKMHNDLSTATSKAVGSVKKFISDPKKEKFELEVVSSNIDESKFGKFKDEICNYLNPYYPDKEMFKNTHAIFIGYDWNKLKLEDWDGKENLTEYLKKEYEKELFKISKSMENKISGRTDIKDDFFKIFFIPFSSVDNARKIFRELLENKK